ncbi:hypothetical protein Tco_0179337 [Tanacetum coccineum]
MVSFLNKSEGSEGFQQIFCQTASASTSKNEEMEITATIDGRIKTITEASIRIHLKLEDSDGISSLPNTEIFKQLALMGPKKTPWEQFSSNIATAIICLATNRNFNFSKMIFEEKEPATMPHDSSQPRVQSLGSDEGSLTLNELIVLCTTLSKKVKYPIIDWEVFTKESRSYWKIIRVRNYTEVYQVFEYMLKRFDRDDLEKLWDLVKKKFSSTEPTIDKENVLWVELKRLFEPDDDDTLWKLQRYMHDPLKWKLYDTCGVHHVSTERGHDIFMLVEKDCPLTRALMTVMLANKLQVDESSEMENELLMKIFYQVERPRT